MQAAAVAGLDHLETIEPPVLALGRRHAAYGVDAHDFEAAGEALLWTLASGLGPAFTSEVRAAWAKAYDLLAT